MQETHASGRSHSRSRYMYARARRDALPAFSAESVALWWYSLVGYGEKVLRPVAVFLLATLAMHVGFEQDWLRVESGEYSIDRLALAPFAFFRFAQTDLVVTGGSRIALLFYQLGSVVLLFFAAAAAAAAVRHLARAST